MNLLLKLEEAVQFIASIILFTYLPFAWWVYPACILLPDVGMIGYLVNTRIGACTYNLTHHKGIAFGIALIGFVLSHQVLLLAGVIMVGHSALDRLLGYGLKYTDNFKHTHLGQLQ